MPPGPKPTNITEYLAALSDDQRTTIARLRETIRAAAPGADESFSYGMPGFTLDGRVLLWFAAWKRHYSLYPIGPAILGAHARECEGYETARGTIRFPVSIAVPYDLVTTLVTARVAELRERGRT